MINRRHLLAGTGAVSALAAAGLHPASARAAGPATTSTTPFSLGVASGDPTPYAVVLWTRLAPQPLAPETGFGLAGVEEVAVEVRVARQPHLLADPDRCLRVETMTATRSDGFSVHHDLTGLHPATTVYYQFHALGWVSPVGRTRTAPDPRSGRPVTFAVINCQSMAGGNLPGGRPNPAYPNGWAHLAQRDDIDFVIHLGDYIYEFGRAAHVPPRPCEDVDDYRTRYGQYKSRPELMAAHARFPFHLVPDDHEFFNDLHGGALRPATIARFNHAAEAYWEHMPFRLPQPGALESTTPNRLAVDRRLRWGRQLDLFLADTRQHRTPSTMLGSTQQQALLDWLRTSDATWTVLAFGQPLTGLGGSSGWVRTDREAITALLAERKDAAPARFNPVVLTGDAHCGVVTHTRLSNDQASRLVATEFVNAPMISGGTPQLHPESDPGALRKAYNKGAAGGWENYRGYSVHTVSQSAWRTEYVIGDQVSDPDGRMASVERWELPAGRPVGSIREVGSFAL